MMEFRTKKMKRNLIQVGFWKDTKSILDLTGLLRDLPDPRQLVDHEWMKEKRERIAQYLDAGTRINQEMGYSYCRFECGVVGSAMGTSDLTDGTYVWPEGLSHYVRVHHVRLPKKFTRHVLDNLPRLKKATAADQEKEALLADAAKQLGEWVAAKKKAGEQANAQ